MSIVYDNINNDNIFRNMSMSMSYINDMIYDS